MRHADFLKEVVSIYRKAIDTYLDNPATYYLNSMEYEQLYNHRVREFTTSMAFTPASASLVDISGSREPLILSRAAKERSLTKEDLYNNPFEEILMPLLNTREHENTVTVHPHLNLPPFSPSIRGTGGGIQGDNEYSPPLVGGVRGGGELLQNTFLPTEGATLCVSTTAIRRPLLAVKVSSMNALKGALDEGADRIYINGEVSPLRKQFWTKLSYREACKRVHDAGKTIGIGTPRITTSREMADIAWLFEQAASLEIDYVLVHNLGAMRLAREFGLKFLGDYSLNV